MTSAELVFKEGFVPVLGPHRLAVLRDACRSDDPRLRQGQTTTPPPLMAVQDWPCEGACALGYTGWQSDNLGTIGEVEEFFAQACFQADQILGEPAACRFFLTWFDDTPRPEMLSTLAEWIDDSLAAQPAALREGTAMPSILDALDWHGLPATPSYPRREYQYVPGRVSGDSRDGTLTIRLSKGKRAGSMWEEDTYGVEEGRSVGAPNPGRVFLLLNLTDPEQPDVYEVLISAADERRDRCTCLAFVGQRRRCKHIDSLRAITTEGSREEAQHGA